MATPKYKKLFQEMVVDNKQLFDEFSNAHGERFEELRRQVLRLIKKNEDKLCARSEVTGYSKFAESLADKFWEEVRANIPNIDAESQ